MKTKKLIGIIALSVLTTIICITILNLILYVTLKKDMTIVFYKTECVYEQITENYNQENVCAYVRLNANKNHILNVDDFSILYDAEYTKAIKVEYFNQIIRTSFQTYPNQPILKIYFNVPHTITEQVIFIKYKNTNMRIGEFATD